MPMYNLLEYSKNYSKTSASLWNYYRDELTDETNDNSCPNKNVINSKSFKYKTSITGSTYNFPRRIIGADGNPVNNPNYDRNKKGTKEVEIAVSLKHLGNFWNSLNILLVKYKTSITGSTYNFPRRIIGADGNSVNNPNYDRNKKGTKEVEIAVSLKHLGNFWNSLNILLVNCEVSLALSWSANWLIKISKSCTRR